MNGKVFLLSVCLPVAAAIIGGLPAPTVNSIPWQVRIVSNTGASCGGTIIAPQWILTAGHCVDGFWESDLTVYTGEYSLGTLEFTEQGHYVAGIFTNGYDSCTMLNDIALIQLTADILFDQFRQPINMALPGEENTMNIFSGCQLTGWGSEFYNGPANNFLEFLNVIPIDRMTCAAQLDISSLYSRGIPDMSPITDQHLCVSGLTGTGGCTGDSGGPLTCQRQYVNVMTGLPSGISETVLLGATSRGSLICGGAPTVYTSVPFFYNWITSTMNMYTRMSPPPLPGMPLPLPPPPPSPFPRPKIPCPSQMVMVPGPPPFNPYPIFNPYG